jgi:hypothetical protein
MEGHRALQATQAPEFSTVLRMPRSLTTAPSRSNFLILLRLGILVTNTTSTCYGDLGSSLQPSWAHIWQGSEIQFHCLHIRRILRDSENDGNQKVIFQRLGGGASSHWILVGQSRQFLPSTDSSFHWLLNQGPVTLDPCDRSYTSHGIETGPVNDSRHSP